MGPKRLANKNKIMQSINNYYIGIDVSKHWFDVSMICVQDAQRQPMLSTQFNNTSEGMEEFSKWLKSNRVSFDEHTLIVIENTGVYHRLLWDYCSKNNLPLHIGNAAGIKWSMGITRGKDDKTDSQRLCVYCLRHCEDLKASPVLDPVILQIKDLMSARTRLLEQISSIKVYLTELKDSNSKEVQKLMEQVHKAAIEGLKKSLKQIEEQIKKQVKENKSIKNNYDLLLSVPGIGHITAVYLICCTSNFNGKKNGKQLASYAGVVPFQLRSGTSIHGKNKVHKMANKELKKLLHLCAMSAVKNYPEFRNYYDRKKLEGKHTMSILNSVRNKIVLRAVAVIKKQQKYVDNLQKVA